MSLAKMARCGVFVFAIIASTALLRSAKTYRWLQTREKLPRVTNESEVTNNEISSFIKTLAKSGPLDLQLLYDSEHEGSASEVARQLSYDVEGLTGFEYNQASSMTLKLLLHSARRTTLVLTFCQPAIILESFREIKAQRLESHLATWIIFLAEPDIKDELVSSLEDLIFEGTRVLLLIAEPGGGLVFKLAQLEPSGVVRFGHKTQFGDSTPILVDHLLNPDYEGLYSDMGGRGMIVTALDSPPFVIMGRELPDGGAEGNTGTDYLFVEAFARALNFTFRTIQPEDGNYGYPQPDGNVTGMIGLVARREANVALGGIAVNDKRDTVIDYVYPYMDAPLCVYSRSPKLRSQALAVLSPFTREVWICVITCVLIMGPVAYAASRVSVEKEPGRLFEVDLQNYSFSFFRNIVNQGNSLVVECWSQRVLFYSWYLFCLVVLALYSGTLTAVLAIPAYEKPIDSLDDLPKAVEDGFTIGVVRDSTNEYVFKEATDGIYKQTWELFNHKDRSKSFVDEVLTGVKRILTEKFVFVTCDVEFIIAAERLGGERKFNYGHECFYPQGAAFPVPSGAPYREIFSKLTLRLVEGGFYKKWEADAIRNYTRGSEVEAVEVSETSALTLTHLQAAFFLVGLGIVISTVVFWLEFVATRLQKRRNKSTGVSKVE